MPEAPASPSSAEGLAALGPGLGEVKILDRDRPTAVDVGKGDELADRGSQPPILVVEHRSSSSRGIVTG
jgi:hypothetical protein